MGWGVETENMYLQAQNISLGWEAGACTVIGIQAISANIFRLRGSCLTLNYHPDRLDVQWSLTVGRSAHPLTSYT